MSRGLVLKMGGSLGGDSLRAVVATVVGALQAGRAVAIVHGGGPRITRALAANGIELPFVAGQRLTTSAAIHIVTGVLSEVNREISEQLQFHGIPARSVPVDGGVFEASPMPGLERTARVQKVDLDAVYAWMRDGQVAIFSPIGMVQGQAYNMNADLAAAALAGALEADRVVFLTDVPGIYEDWENKKLLAETSHDRLLDLYDSGRFHAGMIPKVEAVLASLSAGVDSAFVVDGRNVEAVTWAALSHATGASLKRPLGTHVLRQEVWR